MNGDIRSWEGAQRRVGSMLAITMAIVLLLAAVAAYVFIGDVPWLYWTLAGVLILVLAFVVTLLVVSTKPESAPYPVEGHAGYGPSGPAGSVVAGGLSDPGDSTAEHKLTLRCGDCGTIFDIADNGARPLYHHCPGCGADGVLREAAPEAVSEPAPPIGDDAVAPHIDVAAAPAAAPSPLSAPRRLKLRCGGCKEVFVIEDTGERPLRRPCPHCSRMGEIR